MSVTTLPLAVAVKLMFMHVIEISLLEDIWRGRLVLLNDATGNCFLHLVLIADLLAPICRRGLVSYFLTVVDAVYCGCVVRFLLCLEHFQAVFVFQGHVSEQMATVRSETVETIESQTQLARPFRRFFTSPCRVQETRKSGVGSGHGREPIHVAECGR